MIKQPVSTLIAALMALMLISSHASAESINLPLQVATAGTFYVTGVLDEQVDTDFLLDTGSGYVSLSRDTFDKLAPDASRQVVRHIQGIMANGKKMIVPIYQIAELRLGANCVLHGIEVAVMPSSTRNILGLNAIRQLQPVTLNLDPPSLTGNCNLEI